MSDDEVILAPATFDCEECGKHVGHLNRTERPWRVVLHQPTTVVHSFCGVACAKAWTDRKRESESD